MVPGFRICLVLVTSLLPSCREDFDVILPAPSEPVVYGLINPDDSINHVRLTRTFAGAGPVESLAGNPENLYYDDAVVSLDINSPEGYPMKSFPLERIVLDDRAEGIFAQAPNIMYVLREDLHVWLDEGYQLRLAIVIPDESRLVSAQQIYRTPPEILLPRPSINSYLSLYSDEPVKIEWQDRFGFRKYEVVFRFNYLEHFEESENRGYVEITSGVYSTVEHPDQTDRTLAWILSGDDIFRQLGTRIKADPEVLNRSFSGIDIDIFSLTNEFCEYQETNLISTDRMGRPVTNIVGGLGLFSLRTITSHKGYLLDPISLDSLVKGRFTGHLGFVKW